MKEMIKTDKAPQAIGPYSQAVKCGHALYVSGQIYIDPSTGELIKGGVTEKVNRVMDNIKTILESAGMGMNDLVKVTIFLTDMGAFPTVNKAYAAYFTEYFPARETVQVAKLPKDAEIEISCIACKG
jgi:2-iminobutanoate/2-iminopropanoate deaminase